MFHWIRATVVTLHRATLPMSPPDRLLSQKRTEECVEFPMHLHFHLIITAGLWQSLGWVGVFCTGRTVLVPTATRMCTVSTELESCLLNVMKISYHSVITDGSPDRVSHCYIVFLTFDEFILYYSSQSYSF